MLHLMRPLGPDSYPADAKRLAPAYLESWLRHFPDSQARDRDLEDWIENAGFITAFERLGVDFRILDKARVAMVTAGEDLIAQNDGPEAFLHTGIQRADAVDAIHYRLKAQLPGHLRAIARSAGGDAFRAIANRKIHLVPPEAEALNEAIRAIVPGQGQIFVKTLKKGLAAIYRIDADKAPLDCILEQDDAIAWMLIQHEGATSPFFCVQGVFAPRYEYRVFMVDGKPVSGAGCIEAMTPVNNEKIFDEKMEEIRNSGTIIKRADLVEMYVTFAQRAGRSLAGQLDFAPAYALDLSIDEQTGYITPIEINPPYNLGRYASSIDAWVRAIDTLPSDI